MKIIFKLSSKPIFLILTALILSFFNAKGHITYASGFFSQERYRIPQDKDIFLSPVAQNPDQKYSWSSENTAVATVNSLGVVHGKSKGCATITAVDKNNKSVSKCVVEVTERDPIRIAFVSCAIAGINEEFKAKVLTYKDVDMVKFEVVGNGYNKCFECKNKSIKDNYFLWENSIKLCSHGKYKITAYAKVRGTWKTCDEGTTEIFISDKYSKNTPSLTEKRISAEGADFIALYEGFRPNVYKDPVGIATIGYGKRIYPYEVFYNNLSKIEGINLFLNILNQGVYTKNVNKFLLENRIKFNQQQFDALVSFSYNLGCGWLNPGNDLAKILLNSGGTEKKMTGNVNSSNGLWVREFPSTSAKRFYALPNNTSVEILNPVKENGNWYKVRTPNGIIGYCYAEFLKISYIGGGEKNLDLINRSNFINEFSAYHHACKKCIKELITRRFDELNIFFKGIYKRNYNMNSSNVPYPIPRCARYLF